METWGCPVMAELQGRRRGVHGDLPRRPHPGARAIDALECSAICRRSVYGSYRLFLANRQFLDNRRDTWLPGYAPRWG
jgi:hypothetical protein